MKRNYLCHEYGIPMSFVMYTYICRKKTNQQVENIEVMSNLTSNILLNSFQYNIVKILKLSQIVPGASKLNVAVPTCMYFVLCKDSY